MGNEHIVSIERPANLSMDTGRLEIFFSDKKQKHYVAATDIAVLMLGHSHIKMTVPVMEHLSKNGAVIISVDSKFMPVSITTPVGINRQGAKRPHQQAKYLNTPQSRLWLDQIIKSKIAGQVIVLENINKEKSEYLKRLIPKVSNGDEGNLEGLAAKVYWDEFFTSLNFSGPREKQGAKDIVNSSLNYGYAVIRSIIARALCSAGLCLNFGLGHYRKDNPFNLVEDFIEPFRYIADFTVFSILKISNEKEFSSKLKNQITANILDFKVNLSGKKYRLFKAIDEVVNNFCRSLDDNKKNLALPNLAASKGVKPKEPNLKHIKYEY